MGDEVGGGVGGGGGGAVDGGDVEGDEGEHRQPEEEGVAGGPEEVVGAVLGEEAGEGGLEVDGLVGEELLYRFVAADFGQVGDQGEVGVEDFRAFVR